MKKNTYKFTILGCGSSGGVPRIGNDWGKCNPLNPKNHRSRCSLLIQKKGENGVTNILIDSGPDIRLQLLGAKIGKLDAVIYTHYHADHISGIDDLRMVAINVRNLIPVWADTKTSKKLKSSYSYIFNTPKGSKYPPILKLNEINETIRIQGSGGIIEIKPLEVNHGEINALGFKIQKVAYIPDVLEIPQKTWTLLKDLDVLIIDALRRKPHPSHTHLEKTLSWIRKLEPKISYLTNMHTDIDYEEIQKEIPKNVFPSFDGLNVELIY